MGNCMRCQKPTTRNVLVGYVCPDCAGIRTKTDQMMADLLLKFGDRLMRHGHTRHVWLNQYTLEDILKAFAYEVEILKFSEFSQMPYQARVASWVNTCFGSELATNLAERNRRFFEEAVGLVQATGMAVRELHQMVDEVYRKPAGDPIQKVGGVMMTLSALCQANNLDMRKAGEIELERCCHNINKIREKNKFKSHGRPLPVQVV